MQTKKRRRKDGGPIFFFGAVGFLFLFLILCFLFASLLYREPEENDSSETVTPNNMAELDILKNVQNGQTSVFSSTYQVNRYFCANYFPSVFGAVGDGISDDTVAIQNTLNLAAENGGGVVYLSHGTYRITAPLTVPENVTLRGDFVSPASRRTDHYGTVLVVADTAENRLYPFIQLKQFSSVRDLTVRYETQSYETPVSYPFTVSHVEGTDVTIENFAVLNAYNGIALTSADCERATLRNIYLSALHLGIDAASCRSHLAMENINISSVYWINSILKNTESFSAEALQDTLSQMFTAIRLSAIGDCMMDQITLDTCANGLTVQVPLLANGALSVTDCSVSDAHIPLCVESASMTGMTFAASSFRTNDLLRSYAVYFGSGFVTSATFNSCSFPGQPQYSVYSEGTGDLSFVNCSFVGWRNACMRLSSGIFTAIHNQYLSTKQFGSFGENTVGILCNNYRNATDSETGLLYETQTENVYTTRELEASYLMHDDAAFSVPNVLYDTRDYGLLDGTTGAFAAIQATINRAYYDGGGIVLIPEGTYVLDSGLHVYGNVRLMGVSDDLNSAYCTKLVAVRSLTETEPLIKIDKKGSVTNLAIEFRTPGTADLVAKVAEGKEPLIPESYAIYATGEDVFIDQVSLIKVHNGIYLDQTSRAVVCDVYGTAIRYGVYANRVKGLLLKDLKFDSTYADENVIRYQQEDAASCVLYGGSDIHVFHLQTYNADYSVLMEEETVDAVSDTPHAVICQLFAEQVYAGVCLGNYNHAVLVNPVIRPMIFASNAYYIVTRTANSGQCYCYNLNGSGTISGGILIRGGYLNVQSGIFNEVGVRTVHQYGGSVELIGNTFKKSGNTYHIESSNGSAAFLGNIITSVKTFKGIDDKYLKKYIASEALYTDDYNLKRMN